MSPAVVAVLNGTPEPEDLRCHEVRSRTVVTIGSVALFCYERTDLGSRNIAMATLRSMGFAGQRVAAVFGLGETQVATVRSRALREGPAGVVRRSGRPPKLSRQQLAQAVAWHEDGLSNVDIGRRLGVHNATVSRALSAVRAPVEEDEEAGQEELDLTVAADPASSDMAAPEATTTDVEPSNGRPSTVDVGGGSGGPVNDAPPARTPAWAAATTAAGRIGVGTVRLPLCRGDAAARVHRPGRGRGGVRLGGHDRCRGVASTTSRSCPRCRRCSRWGSPRWSRPSTPTGRRSARWPAFDVLPELRTLRPRLAAIADGCDPLGLQRAFATAMLAADPCTSGVYFVDEHFVPYTGKQPVGKGWNTKRRHAEAGRVDTMVADAAGRAVCFTAGEPAGLSVSLPATLAELNASPATTRRSCSGSTGAAPTPSVFTVCRDDERGLDHLPAR